MRKTLARLAALVVPFLAMAIAAPAAGASTSSRLCVPVQASGVGQDNGVNAQGRLTTTGVVLVGGVEVATSQATFTPGAQSGNSLPFSGPILLTSQVDTSTLTAEVAGSVDLATGTFLVRSTGLTGTGALAGVSGHLRFRGRENLATGAFTERISGTLCTTLP